MKILNLIEIKKLRKNEKLNILYFSRGRFTVLGKSLNVDKIDIESITISNRTLFYKNINIDGIWKKSRDQRLSDTYAISKAQNS